MSLALFFLLHARFFLAPLPAETSGPQAVLLLDPDYSAPAPDAAVPFAGFDGSHVFYSDGVGVTGVDPKTSLVRWQGGELKTVRYVVDYSERFLMVGEHAQMMSKKRGKRVWDFPLNCFSAAECNADILARTDDFILVGGFGKVYNMVVPVSLQDGKQLWPSWLTTCGIRKAALVADSLVLACASEKPLVQKIDLKTRLTRFAVPSPVAGFSTEDLYASNTYLFLVGTVEGQRKLLVLDTGSGTLVARFGVKESAGESGYLVSPDAGRFVPWQVRQAELVLWGIDAGTEKTVWQQKYPSGRIVGQEGALAVILASSPGGSRLVGLDLAGGKAAYDLELPFPSPAARLDRGQLLVLQAGDSDFVVLEAGTGEVTHLGTLKSPPPAAPRRLYFSWDSGRFVTLVDNEITLYASGPIATLLSGLDAALSSGDRAEADRLHGRLAPFRSVLPDASRADEQMTRFRWLLAEIALRKGQTDEAAELASTGIALAREQGLPRWLGQVARFALEVAAGPQSDATGQVALDALMLVRDFAIASAEPSPEGATDEILVQLLVALAQPLSETAASADALDSVRRLHEVPRFAPLVEAHPFWTIFLVKDVETTLEAAGQAAEVGETGLAAELLRDLAKLPMAGRLFGDSFDPWLDAQGLYLMPEELQAERLPPLLKALSGQARTAGRSVLSEADQEACRLVCATAARFCPGTCISQDDCRKEETACTRTCRSGKPRFRPVKLNVPLDAKEVYQCR
ncbi:MAG: hypothetical protein FJ109_18025 [Deltaproteobacteria bacterium]|nr:hypothetical protein [Deltaproteobacteria bacterium]